MSHLVEKGYVTGWPEIANELQRIARWERTNYDAYGSERAANDAQDVLMGLAWERVYDFCERLHAQLAKADAYEDFGHTVERKSKADVQQFITEELNLLFHEESLAFEFERGLRSAGGGGTPWIEF